ncbi:MAG: preprotein translocase subunit SecE [Candidatus Marinimicrobia bacterium]|nr:preprotein translocase subunit SecE [Candidatus Neomarinimicrobiota bacterium]
MIKRFRAFLQGVEFEMKKVSWPTMNELRGSTGVVLVLSLLLVIFLFFVDLGLSQIVKFVL